MFTLFWDMHSGGIVKEPPYEQIFIEGSRTEATEIFVSRFGHDPADVACPCCGENYAISEYETLEDAAKYHIGKHKGIGEYLDSPQVLVLTKEDTA